MSVPEQKPKTSETTSTPTRYFSELKLESYESVTLQTFYIDIPGTLRWEPLDHGRNGVIEKDTEWSRKSESGSMKVATGTHVRIMDLKAGRWPE